jgi:Zn-dependent protease with chaperone function
MRHYHEQRAQARGLTTQLCLALALAVVGTIAVSALAMAAVATAAAYGYLSTVTTIVMPAGYWRNVFYDRVLQAGVLTLLAVVGTAVYRSWQLAGGGGRLVARALGGTRVSTADNDPGSLRLLNVVEELAIATGMRPPPVFVLHGESGINAFAAGFGGKDAVIGVTQGALDRLQRPQLQGVLAHEFSHIINGDMRLNIQILGVLTGVQAISFAARFLLRLALPANEKEAGRRYPLGMVLALGFGAALWPIGQVGSLFAQLIHAAVNRQREFLADASAVHYTRDPLGLCEALTLLLEDETGGRLVHSEARLASYMFFAPSSTVWQRLLHTHPPLEERIRRLDPHQESDNAWGRQAAAVPQISEAAEGRQGVSE